MQQLAADDFDISSIPLEFSPLAHTLDNSSAAKMFDGDDKLYVTFKTEAILNPAASTKAGRPIYDDIDMITVRTPGSQLTSIVDHAKRYTQGRPVLAQKYRDWKTGQVEASSGTPLENFPFLFTKPSLIAELKYRHVFSVEQLATLPDNAKQGIMGGYELSKKAQEWLDKTAGDAQDAEKAELKQRLADMEAKLASLAGEEAPKRRRKAAVESTEVETPDFLT